MKWKKRYSFILVILLFVSGCSKKSDNEIDKNISSSTTTTVTDLIKQQIVSIDISQYSYDYVSNDYTELNVNDLKTIEQSGVYVLSGTVKNQSIEINVDKNVDKNTVYLILKSVTMDCENITPIVIHEAEEVVIIVEGNNVIQQGAIETQEEEFPSGAIYSKADLVITGSGTLNIHTDYNDAITSKDDLLIINTTITVNANQDGIVGKDLLYIEDSNITVTSGKDGIRSTNDADENKGNIVLSNNNLSIVSKEDAIQAEGIIQIVSGTYTLQSGGGYPGQSTHKDTEMTRPNMEFGKTPPNNSMEDFSNTDTTTDSISQKGIKGNEGILIQGGTIFISSYDDAIHSNGNIQIDDGIIEIQTGDDGIHADNKVEIHNGTILINNSYEGIEGDNILIQGGNVTIISTDDGINVSLQGGVLEIHSGYIYVQASGDGLDSNGDIIVQGGEVIIDATTIGKADTPIDYDGTFTMTNGTIVDTNGNDIDTTMQQMGGGNKGNMMDRPKHK